MKKVALSKMKCAILFAMMLFTYQGMAQDVSLYIGDNCKFYPAPNRNSSYPIQIAHLVTDEHNSSVKYTMADKITLIHPSLSDTRTLTSEYGNYVEFYDVNNDCFKIFDNSFAFTKNGSSLYYIIHSETSPYKEKEIYTITTDLEIADDFQIIFYQMTYGFCIKNNGILTLYSKTKLPRTKVNSPKVDEKEDAAYSIDGKKVQTPHNGIFIKGDKKVMIK